VTLTDWNEVTVATRTALIPTQQLVTKTEADPPSSTFVPLPPVPPPAPNLESSIASSSSQAHLDPSVQTDVFTSTVQSTGFGLTTEAPTEASAEPTRRQGVLTMTSTYFYSAHSEYVQSATARCTDSFRRALSQRMSTPVSLKFFLGLVLLLALR
jgi:hypothetical protein